MICAAVTRLKKISKHQDLLFSSERICDCSASLRGDSIHNSVDEEFLLYSLARVCANVGRQYPLIMACFREPISYLRSKYIRTWGIRQNGNLREISPKEYIQKQAFLEKSHPGTSALAPAMHSEFIKQLQRHAYVKAFGFQELIGSGDVFNLLGLYGEDKFAFREFPRENKFPVTKDQENMIEVQIVQALKQYDFYERVAKAQMFE